MKSRTWPGILTLAGLLFLPAASSARSLSVELWTDRGNEAVYQPGDPIVIKSRLSDDAYLLVYEIDAEGAVNLLFPTPGHGAGVEGRHTYRLPDQDHGELVVDNTTGEGYIVAIASTTPFEALPWYLRPVNEQAEGVGYYGEPPEDSTEDEGVTQDGHIVGDPFVAMERIRRRVLRNASDESGFATAYTSYYVHERVRYPRYLCNDCHRPGHYAWWDGWDPYYSTCSVFDFRINWSWGWGPRYWFGTVPYFVYVYRDDCPPAYRRYSHSGVWYSGWDGWNRWCDLWGKGGLRRYKTAPPVNYVPPAKYASSPRTPRAIPPGFLATSDDRHGRLRGGVGFGVGDESPGARDGGRTRTRRDEPATSPRELRPGQTTRTRGSGELTPTRGGDTPRGERGFNTPRSERPREGVPATRRDRPNIDRRPAPAPARRESPAPQVRRNNPAQRESRRPAPPRQEVHRSNPPPAPAREAHRDEPAPRSRDEGSRSSRGNENRGGRKHR